MPLIKSLRSFTSLPWALILTSLSCLHFSHAATPVEYVNYQKVQLEERAWAGLKTNSVRIGDIVWSYSEGGAKNKPTIVLIHGIGGNKDTWNDVARELTQHYHVIIPDLPGSGSTQVSKNFDLSLNHLNEQLRRFIETLNIQNNLNIAGHSVGGSVALMYASKYNFDTQSVFLISSGGLFKNNQTSYLNNPIYLKQLLVTKPGDLDFVLKKVMYRPPFVPSIIKKQQEQLLIEKSLETSQLITQLTELNKEFNINSYAAMLKNIEAPTLILWGKQDQIVNVEVAQELKSYIKRAQDPIILNNVGHVPILEAPQKVAQSYLAFLNTVQLQQNMTSKPNGL